MGGPIEKFIEPLGEKILAKLFPIFQDRNEIKIGVNHFLTHVFITMTFASFGLLWIALGTLVLVPIAEFQDVKKGRWVDVFARTAGWAWGLLPLLIIK